MNITDSSFYFVNNTIGNFIFIQKFIELIGKIWIIHNVETLNLVNLYMENTLIYDSIH